YLSGVFLSFLFSRYAVNIFFTSSKSFSFKAMIAIFLQIYGSYLEKIPERRPILIKSGNFDDSRDFGKVAYQAIQVIGAMHVQFYGTFKNPTVRIHGNGPHVYFKLIGYHLGQIID